MNAPAAQPAAPAPGVDAKSRTWADASGMFKIEAEFISLKDDTVELKRPDGKVITLTLDKLSVADQAIAKSLGEATKISGDQPVASTPFKASQGIQSDSGVVNVTVQENETKVSFQGATQVSLTPPPTWNVTPDPATTAPSQLKLRKISIPARLQASNQPGHVQAMLSDPRRNWMWLGIAPDSNSFKTYRFERVDLESGKVLPAVELSIASIPLAIDPTGKFMASLRCTRYYSHYRDQIDLWQIDGESVNYSQSFRPYPPSEVAVFSTDTIKKAEFIDAENLITVSTKGRLVVWSLPSLTAKYQVNLGRDFSTFALSPGRRQLAISTSTGQYVLEALTGKVLGKFAAKTNEVRFSHVRVLHFKDDGSQLAGYDSYTGGGLTDLRVWDVKSGGELVHLTGHVNAGPTEGDNSAIWLSSGHLLVGSHWAVDLERRVSTAVFRGSWFASTSVGEASWYLFADERSSTFQLVNCSPITDQLVQRARAVPVDQLLAIKPGDKVALSLEFPTDHPTDEIRAAFTARIEANGWKVGSPNDPCRVLIHCIKRLAGSREVTYRSAGQVSRGNLELSDTRVEIYSLPDRRLLWCSYVNYVERYKTYELAPGATLAEYGRNFPGPADFQNFELPSRILDYQRINPGIFDGTISLQRGVTFSK
ncbi:SHD1 domain-containing protein [Anatilimnocola aggregata]|nr:SHD1 domain-containing protein [Anatilimnocola aggregata]